MMAQPEWLNQRRPHPQAQLGERSAPSHRGDGLSAMSSRKKSPMIEKVLKNEGVMELFREPRVGTY